MTFLFWGFTALWAAIVVYVWSLVARQRKLAEDIEMFHEVLKEQRSSGTE